MGLRAIRERFRGREFWRGANRFIGVSLYTLLLVGVMAFPMYLGYLILAYVVVIPSYVAFFINHLREMEKMDKGNKIIEGWITHAYGVGERVYFYPIDFQIEDKLSPDDLTSVKDYVMTLRDYSKVTQTGLERFKTKQLTYPDHVNIAKMNSIERKNFDEGETKERDEFLKERNEMKTREQVKTTINEDEPKDE